MINSKYILLLTLLYVIVINQEGGSSKRSISISKGNSRSKGISVLFQRNVFKSLKIDSIKLSLLLKYKKINASKKCVKNICKCKKEHGKFLFSHILSASGIVGGLLGIFIFVFLYKDQKQMEVKKQIKEAFLKKHTENIKQYEANESEIDQLSQSFVSKKLSITLFQEKNIYVTQRFSVSLSKKDKFLYDIKFTTHDFFGKATYEGYLSFSSKGQKLWLMKDYQNKQKAGQTENWQYLIYEGDIINNIVNNGRWYYKGTNSKYSGSWKMAIKRY